MIITSDKLKQKLKQLHLLLESPVHLNVNELVKTAELFEVAVMIIQKKHIIK